MRISFLFLLLAFLGPLSPALAARGIGEKLHATKRCSQGGELEDKQKLADLVIRIYEREEFEDCVEVLRGNRLVYAGRADGRLGIGNDINKGADSETYHAPVIPIGTDITGLGEPDVILNEWSGGAHCCFTFHVLELSEHPREIAAIDAEDSDYAHFEDLKHDGAYEFVGRDFVFAYWNASFLQSPAPRIVLRFNGDRYELAPELMRQHAPSAEKLEATEHEVRKASWQNGSPPPLLWETMLDLIYTGHPELAQSFLDHAWIPAQPGKEVFQHNFCSKLVTSLYFRALSLTMPNAPCAPDPQK